MNIPEAAEVGGLLRGKNVRVVLKLACKEVLECREDKPVYTLDNKYMDVGHDEAISPTTRMMGGLLV